MRGIIRAIDDGVSSHAPCAWGATPKILILCLHSVLANRGQLNRDTHLPQQGLTLGDLKQAVETLQEMGFRFVSAAEVEKGLPVTGKFCLITFDDGYRNNLDALSLLRRYEVPALFFVVPENIESGKSFWWDAVYRRGRHIGKSENEIGGLIAKVKLLPPTEIMGWLRHAGLRDADFMPTGDLDRPMTRTELAELSRCAGSEVGNHTWGHEILTRSSVGDGQRNLEKAQKYLRAHCRHVCDWIAYPNGDYNPNVLKMASEAGLRWGVTLDAHWQRTPLPSSSNGRLMLGRFLLWGGENISQQCTRLNSAFSLHRSGARVVKWIRRMTLATGDASKLSAVVRRNDRTNKWFSRPIYFVYPDAAVQTGQRRATEIIIDDLSAKGVECLRFGTPALGPDRTGLVPLLWFAWSLLCIWFRAFVEFRRRPGILHINLGQSSVALLRDGAFALLRGSNPRRSPVIISLHGMWFMRWQAESRNARALCRIARTASAVTVLGPEQREQLIGWGVAAEKIEVVDNTCELVPISPSEALAKHCPHAPVKVLFLGILIDTKGYPELLEALELYAVIEGAPPLQVTLCGEIATASHAQRFHSAAEARSYIEEKIAKVRRTRRVDITWLHGAEGATKAQLFRDATLFVLPSKLDSQPLVLLEAMATGCPIIASKVGEIPQTVGTQAAMLLDKVSPQAIADALFQLALDPAKRATMAVAGINRFHSRFTRQIYREKWELIFRRVSNAAGCPGSGPRIWFAFADSPGFSGQKAATEVLISGLEGRGMICRRLPLPVRARGDSTEIVEVIRYSKALISAWARALLLILRRGWWLHLNIGQTRTAFLRDSIPLFAGRFGLRRSHVIISLHGSVFMHWSPGSLNACAFAFLLRQAGTVTVLGSRQREHLIELGVPRTAIVVVPNTCEFLPMESAEIEKKLTLDSERPVRVLHLSSLIATKGYPEYIEALLLLSRRPGPSIQAVLCGPLVASAFADRFSTSFEAESWIENKIATINAAGSRVTVEWVRGARGEPKAGLYRAADIFVMPTSYQVEAQPLVLLEAMATACAIVTTRIGEIDSILNEDTAVFLTHPTALCVADALECLIQKPTKRVELARAGYERFRNEYQLSRHLDQWERIFGGGVVDLKTGQ